MTIRFFLFLLLIVGLNPGCSGGKPPVVEGEKIGGVNMVAPSSKVNESCMPPLQRIGAGWVALNPYAYGRSGDPQLVFDIDWQWWGETSKGTQTMLEYAQKEGLKVMIKPHIWVRGEGWAGDFKLNSDADWEKWEASFKNYILTYARMAQKYKAEMLCIGTEVRQSVKQRPQFWEDLITEVRKVYDGKLTYASNWDNFHEVKFWSQLDYIGVDAYFPLSEEKTATTATLVKAWQPTVNELKSFSARHNKPILFTEFGYRSMDQTTWKQWLLLEHWENKDGIPNLDAQKNAYEAIFEAFWSESWFAGGFLWKWYPEDSRSGGEKNLDYTPQHKPVEEMIKKWYASKS